MSETLDEAWAEVEAALPESWWVAGLWWMNREGVWTAVAYGRLPEGRNGDGRTPAAALRALAARLRSHDPAPTSEEP